MYRRNLEYIRPKLDLNNLPLLIFVNKGIEVGTHALTLEIIVDTCGPEIAKAAAFIVSTHFHHIRLRVLPPVSLDLPSQKRVSW